MIDNESLGLNAKVCTVHKPGLSFLHSLSLAWLHGTIGINKPNHVLLFF